MFRNVKRSGSGDESVRAQPTAPDSMLLMGIPSPDLAALAVHAGVRAVIVDLEHGFLGLGAVQPVLTACRAAGGMCFVRVTSEMLTWLGPLADIGVDGVVLSGVRSFSDVEQAAARLTLFPAGRRSINPFVAAAGRPGHLAGLRQSAAGLSLWAMAETAEFLEQVRQAEPGQPPGGLTGIMVGPYDLAGELGLEPPTPQTDALAAAVRDFAQWATTQGLPWGLFVRDLATWEAWVAGRGLAPPVIIGGYDRDIWFNAVRSHIPQLTKDRTQQ